jgi:hypothetical protein
MAPAVEGKKGKGLLKIELVGEEAKPPSERLAPLDWSSSVALTGKKDSCAPESIVRLTIPFMSSMLVSSLISGSVGLSFGGSGGGRADDFFFPRNLSRLLLGVVGEGGPGLGEKGSVPEANEEVL